MASNGIPNLLLQFSPSIGLSEDGNIQGSCSEAAFRGLLNKKNEFSNFLASGIKMIRDDSLPRNEFMNQCGAVFGKESDLAGVG